MRRRWFRAREGGFYRNCPLIMDEMERTPFWRVRKLRALSAEWDKAFAGEPPHCAELGRRDVLVEPAPFRETYPNHPGFWLLDDRDTP